MISITEKMTEKLSYNLLVFILLINGSIILPHLVLKDGNKAVFFISLYVKTDMQQVMRII